jgi:lysophospholipase L1-like esterase
MSTRVRLRLQRLALLASSLLICILLLEGMLRLVVPIRTFVNPLSSFHRGDSELGWIGRPAVEARFRKPDFDVLIRHDENGFRVRESAVKPSPGSPVIAVLGDSFTWGWGVNNGQVLTAQLQDRLGPGTDVRNFGLNAYGTVQELLLLKRKLAEGLRPTWVVLMLFQNDYYDNISAHGDRPAFAVAGTNVSLIHCPISKPAIRPSQDWIKRSYLASALGYLVDYTREKRRIRNLQHQVFRDGRISTDARTAMGHALRQLHETCRQAGSRLLCVYVTARGEAQAGGGSAARDTTQALCQEAGLAFLDLTPEFSRLAPNELNQMYFPNDEHWTAKGHQLAAEVLARFFKESRAAAIDALGSLPAGGG